MPLSSHAQGCLGSVVALTPEETQEVLDRTAKLAKERGLDENDAIKHAVQELVSELRGKPVDKKKQKDHVMQDVVAEVTGGTTDRKAKVNEVVKAASNDLLARIDAARAAGEITKAQEEALLDMAIQGERGRQKAKDELLRYREEHAEKKMGLAEAGKLWNDPDWMYQDGDPKFADLPTALQEEWAKAARNEKTSIELYDDIVARAKVAASTPKIDNDVSSPSTHPDLDAAPIDHTLPDFKTGGTALAWLANNARSPWVRDVAERIQSYVGDVPITFLEAGQRYRLPSAVASQFRGEDAVHGLTHMTVDGQQHVYVRVSPDQQASEVLMLHELVHVATQAAIAKNKDLANELRGQLLAIRAALRERSEADAKTYASVMTDPHELLAYAFSSPKLREFMKSITHDGRPFGLREEHARASAERQAERAFPTPQMSMWQKFVDFVRSALGLDKVYAPKLDKMLAENEARKTEFLAGQMSPNIYDTLDKLFQRTLDAQAGQGTALAPAPVSSPMAAAGQTSPAPTNVQGLALPDFQPGNRFATRLKDWAGGWKNKPGMLGWLTLRQIADRFKDIPGVTKFADLSQRMSTKAKTLMAEAHAVDKDWAGLAPDEAKQLHKLMIETTLDQLWPFKTEKNDIPLQKPGMEAKWQEYAKRYNALSETAKRVYMNAQAKMRKDWDERGHLLRAKIINEYRAELAHGFPGAALDKVAAAPKTERADILKGRSPQEQKSLKSMWGDVDEHGERLAQMHGPYFPLLRFGDHVVVAKSADYITASERFDRAKEHLAALQADDETLDTTLEKAREAVTLAQTALDNLKDQDKHYLVEFYESPTEAKARERQLKEFFGAKGANMAVYSERRVDHFQRLDTISPTFMKKLEDRLSSNLPDKDANAIRQAVRDLYIQAMPERSALKSQLRRLGVKGAKPEEMRRSFAAASMRNSWHLSRLEYGDQMQHELQALRNGDSDEQRVVGGELARRLVTSMQQDNGNLLLDRFTNLSYLTYLGLSPSFVIMNAAQPWVISLPIMAGKFGIKRSAAELGRALNEVGAAMLGSARDQKTWRFELDLEKFSEENGERQMLKDLFNKGIIDVTIEHDLGSLASGQETGRMGKVMQFATLPAHHTEVVNRVMTALAAYRLAMSGDLGRAGTPAEATQYAESVVADTHLDYTPENAPRFMRTAALGGLGRVVFQFKKYMQGMIYLNAKLALDASRGDKEAGRSLIYLLGMNMGVAGMSGLPFAAPVGLLFSAIAKMWPDDDEPEIAELLYQGLKDAVGEVAARAIVKGLPAALGVDVSKRLGQGDILNPIAYAKDGAEGKDFVAHALLALSGPAMSMTANWAEALKVAADDPAKAATTALPKVLADPIRAIDRYNRGVTSRAGTTLIEPDEFGPLGLAMRAVGFEATGVTDMYEERAAFADMKKRRDDTRSRLLRHLAEATEQGSDTEGAQEDANEFNERHPGVKITASTLRASIKARREAQSQMIGGIRVRPQDRELADELGVDQP